MARMLMCASRLFPLLHCKICRPGISGTYFQIRNYTKSGKRKSKSDGIDNEEDKVCEKELALKKALDQVASFFGKESTMWLRRCTSPRCVPVISSGSFALDAALGIGGFPKGRIVEIYGPEASGKTTLALHVIAEAQKDGGYCVFVDAEHALDPALAEAIGVNTENLMLSQPDSGEQALSLVDTLIQSGSVDVVVVDSVAALVPKTELDGEIGDAHIAVQARLISQALRKLIHSLSLSWTVLIFTNQVRSKLNTCGRYGGPTEVSSGGNALKFYASVRLNIKRIGLITKGEEIIGSEVLVKVVKNKLAPPFKTAQFELEFGKGINRGSEILELGCKHKLITKSGLYYTIYDQSFHGKDSVMRYLEHADVQGELLMKLREKLLHSGVVEREEKEDDLSPDSLEDELAPLVIEA